MAYALLIFSQSRFVDYVIVMAYDEHYAGTDAGSVASLPFVKEAVEDTVQLVGKDVKAGLDKTKEGTLKNQVEAKENMQQKNLLEAPLKEPVAEKTFVLKKSDGMVLGQYDDLKDGWDESTILGMMKKTDPNGSYIIEVTKDYEFEGGSRSVISGLNITFTSKEGTSPILTSGNGMPHFFLKDGNYTFKNIIMEGKSGSTGGGIYTHDDNQGITITLDSGTVIRNCNYVDAPYFYRPIVIRDKFDDGNDSKLIISFDNAFNIIHKQGSTKF